jgi:RNA polymerase sigma-70 factor (ECF subfamily)
MQSALSLQELVIRLRTGSQEAATELFARYGEEIHRYVHYRLTDPRLRTLVDSLDICQSVLGNFLLRLSKGELRLDDSRQLMGLLTVMARHKLCDVARKQAALRRQGFRGTIRGQDALNSIPQAGNDPADMVGEQELLAAVRKKLTEGEQMLVEMRLAGCDWAEIAHQCQTTPEAARKRMTRALDRAARELGLAENLHDQRTVS